MCVRARVYACVCTRACQEGRPEGGAQELRKFYGSSKVYMDCFFPNSHSHLSVDSKLKGNEINIVENSSSEKENQYNRG